MADETYHQFLGVNSMFSSISLAKSLFGLLAFAAVSLSLSTQSKAAIIVSLDGLPTTYTAGTPFTFDVVLQNYTNLNSFNIELQMSADSGVAGTDYYFTGATGLLFNDGNFATSGLPSQFITLSDFHNSLEFSGSSTVVATVTGVALFDVGAIQISILGGSIELLDFSLAEIPGFPDVELFNGNVAPGPANPNQAIPEPTSLLAFGFLSLSALGFKRFQSRSRGAGISIASQVS